MEKRTTRSTVVDKKTKKVIKDEASNKKIIIISLVIALLLGVFAYWQVSKNNDDKDNKTNNKKEITEKEETKDDEEDKVAEENEFYSYVKEHMIKPVKAEVEEEKVENTYYSLKFETNGGEPIDDQIITQDEVTSLQFPIKEGWVFQGWYKDESLKEEYTFGNALTEDTTVYAKWGKYISYLYEQSFYQNENLVSENEVIPFLSEEKTGEVPEGYELGWFVEVLDDETNEILVSFEIFENTLLTDKIYSNFKDGNVILTGKLLEKFNMEFFEDELATSALHVEEVVEGRQIPFEKVNNIVKEQIPELESFGWFYYDEDSIKWNVNAEQKATKEITKLYLDETYTLIYTEEIDDEYVAKEDDKFTTDGNLILKEETVSQDSQIKDEDIFKPSEKEGYDFIGWFLIDEVTGGDGDMLTEETIIDGDKVYVGRWKEKGLEEVIEVMNLPIETESNEEIESTPEETELGEEMESTVEEVESTDLEEEKITSTEEISEQVEQENIENELETLAVLEAVEE